MIGLCLTAGALAASLPIQAFTLAWTHSIEMQRWEEDWRISAAGLQVVESRIKGFGAGMEAPEGAVLSGGVYRFRPQQAALPELLLAHSPYAMPYELCVEGQCRPLDHWLPGLPGTATVALQPCAPRAFREIPLLQGVEP